MLLSFLMTTFTFAADGDKPTTVSLKMPASTIAGEKHELATRLKSLEAQLAEVEIEKEKLIEQQQNLQQAIQQYGRDFDAARAYAHSLGDLPNFLIKVEGVPADKAEDQAREHIARWTTPSSSRRTGSAAEEIKVKHAHDVHTILNPLKKARALEIAAALQQPTDRQQQPSQTIKKIPTSSTTT